jgi:CRP/FNR family cyclic AMP-dependent transcriptional regulator
MPFGTGNQATSGEVMRELLDTCSDRPAKTLAAGTILLEQGVKTGRMYVLVRGSIEILRGSTQVAILDDPGALVGEMSILLNSPHTATARALTEIEAYFIADGAEFFRQRPEASYLVARMLARRLNAATTYLADLKQQFAGETNHLEIVGDVLAALIHQQSETVIPGSDRDPRLP